MIYRDYVTATGVITNYNYAISEALALLVAQKIVERNNGFTIGSTTSVTGPWGGTQNGIPITNGNFKIFVVPRYYAASNNSFSPNGLTIVMSDADNTMIAYKAIHDGVDGNSTELGVYVNCYKADNGNCIYKFGAYNDGTDGFDFSLISMVDDDTNEEEGGYLVQNDTLYKLTSDGATTPCSILKNTNLCANLNHVYMKNAQIKNTNSMIIRKHCKSTYEVIQDGGMEAGSFYVINENTYMYYNNLLWKV